MVVRPTQLTDIISWLGIGPQQLAELINAMGDVIEAQRSKLKAERQKLKDRS